MLTWMADRGARESTCYLQHRPDRVIIGKHGDDDTGLEGFAQGADMPERLAQPEPAGVLETGSTRACDGPP